MNKINTLLLRVSAVLWFIWGVVHVLAGVLTMNFVISGDISSGFSGIADAVDPSTLQFDYADAVGAILGQHGFNLFWGGMVTVICAYFIWRKSKNAIFLAAIVGGLLDLGYFLFLDLGEYVNFMPGTVMTLVSSAAIILSFYAYFSSKKTAPQQRH
ncbi:MAG: hypothetical protein AAFV46_01275 [Cyanobacteria bacterium J06635_11]